MKFRWLRRRLRPPKQDWVRNNQRLCGLPGEVPGSRCVRLAGHEGKCA